VWWLCPSPEEWHLAYVAVTRAQLELVHPFAEVVRPEVVASVLAPRVATNEVVNLAGDGFNGSVDEVRPPFVGLLFRSSAPDVVVAGTSYCQKELEAATNDVVRTDDGWPVTAVIRREPDNRFDSNAVMVTVLGRKVGYVPKEFAPTVGEALDNEELEVPAIVVGGFAHQGKRALLGLRLYLGWRAS
jgi:hypothetical protein